MKINKRILIITPSMSKGGAETQLVKVALHLQENLNKVLIISLKPINEFTRELEDYGLNVVFLRNWGGNSKSNIVQLYSLIKEFKPSVVIAFMFIAIIFARIYKVIFGFKLIATIRTSVIKKKWYLPFRLTKSLDDIVVYNSFASKVNFEKRLLARKKGIVINNGISIPKRQINNSVASGNVIFNWVCVAHFSWNKDYQTLFKAVSLIKDHSFSLSIVGKLNNKTWPFEMLRELGIENRIKILGFKPDVTQDLIEADAFVMSSFNEGMPNAILEAMSHGKLVVVSDIDGNRELINEAQCGLLFEKGNAKDLAEKLLKVMAMSSLERNRIGFRGAKYIECSFKQETVMRNWMEIVDQYSV